MLFALFCLLFLAGCTDGNVTTTQNTNPVTASSPTSDAVRSATPKPTQTPLSARLGDPIRNFDQKFGKEDTSSDIYPDVIGYQPLDPYHINDKYSITTDHRRVTGVTVTFSPLGSGSGGNLIDWQAGVKICQSFLPSDAVFQNDRDFGPMFPSYQQMYLSKKMAQEFSPDFFVEGLENTTPVTPGTVQIMYHYTSWSDHTDNAQISVCDVSLGHPY